VRAFPFKFIWSFKMANRDLHHNIKTVRSIAPVAVGTTGTGQTGKIVDTAGYAGVEVVASYGAITATNAAFTLTVKHGDVTGTMTSVADADLIGLEASAVPGTGARVSGTTMNVTKRIGYLGAKRYVSANIKSTVTAATPVCANVVLGEPRNMPVAT
jgi:hypothetical protein